MATTYKKIGGIKTRFRVKGEGSPILILHGWGASLSSWEKVQEKLAQKGFEVYCPDLPGFGKTEKLAAAWDLDDYSNWVDEFCEYFKLNNIIIIAHSFGGRITIKLNQSSFKERIKKNILIAPAGVKINLNKKQKTLSFISKIGNSILSLPLLRIFKGRIKKIFYLILPKMDYIEASPVMQETMKKVIEKDLTPLLSNIKKETILIWGKKDKMVPVRVSEIFKKEIEKTEVNILTKNGHSPHLEDPQKLIEAIIKYL